MQELYHCEAHHCKNCHRELPQHWAKAVNHQHVSYHSELSANNMDFLETSFHKGKNKNLDRWNNQEDGLNKKTKCTVFQLKT